MARRPSAASVPRAAELSPDQMRRAKKILEVAAEGLGKFEPQQIARQYSPEVNALRVAVKSALERAFGADTVEFKRYERAARLDDGPYNYAYEVPPSEYQQTLTREKQLSLSLLQQAISDLDQELSFEQVSAAPLAEQGPSSRRIFLVHGHDNGPKEAIARFLSNLGFEPIILHEKPNEGRTIIEKFEHHSDVGFAVVIMTPDDVGGVDDAHLASRPRQNVLLELGFFLGKLDRRHVCALKRGDLDLPSDYNGVLWTDFDEAGAWRQNLAKELQAAGYEINWNTVMRG